MRDRTPEFVGIGMGVLVVFLLACTLTCYLHGRSARTLHSEDRR